MQIYNTLSRTKEPLHPINAGEIRMYVCGPTVYNYFHIGNARAFTMFDVMRRHLQRRGFKVTYVQNFTDIDDKMIKAANEQGITTDALAKQFIAEYNKDAAALGITPPDVAPRATEHMPEIIGLIGRLFDRGLAYQSDDGVYFDTQAYKPYGKLSTQNPEDREAGARVDVDENKRNPMDFALWKARKEGEPFWPSPWGEGRPGWHIECSAMSMKYLGESFDIHAGGVDLVFPHHENEIAQSEGATGKPYVKYWTHVGFINVDDEKMSKSLGNFFTIREVGEKFDLEVVRFFLLSAHYRSPVNFADQLIEQAQSALNRLYTARNDWRFALSHAQDRALTPEESAFIAEAIPALRGKYDAFMDDDLNTAGATGVLFDLIRAGNTLIMGREPAKPLVEAALALLAELSGALGILAREESGVDPAAEALAQQRQEARARKDWPEADRLRAELSALGYAVKDTPQGYQLIRE